MRKSFCWISISVIGCSSAAPGIYELVVIAILFILFIAPIFVTYKIAKKMNRNVTGWTITSILLGWIAVIILALLPKKNN